MSSRFGVSSRRVVVHNSTKPGLVLVEDGVIADLVDRDASFDGPVVDVGDQVLMPALIDTSVRTGDPGRAHWEGYATATAAAAAGGNAAFVDMPDTSDPPVVTTSAIAYKHSATAGVIRVDVGLWGGIVPGNLLEVRQMADLGVFGFAATLGHGVREFQPLAVGDLEPALRAAWAERRPLLVRPALDRGGPSGPGHGQNLAAHPPEAEVQGVAAAVDAVRRTGAWAHILSLSAADALPMLTAARAEGLMITVDTTPHHLTFATEEIADDDTAFAASPPIRGSANREALWDGLLEGTIDMVVSDHTPSPPPTRTGGLVTTTPGIASLELRLPALWTEARRRGIPVGRIAHWLSRAPAGLARLRSGRIEPGMRADLVAWDPEAEFVVEPSTLHQRHPATPYTGLRLSGVVGRTWSAGRTVYAAGALVGEPSGQILDQD